MKNRVRLIRPEEDGNENEGHFVSVGGASRFAPARVGGVAYVDSFLLCGGN